MGEKGTLPYICIYSYPELKLYRLLREGTEQAYSDLDFSSINSNGKLLASVGSSPDYMLTVWDWKQEKIVLRCKAFSQEIYRVTFSPDNEGQLTTSGTGHIRYLSSSQYMILYYSINVMYYYYFNKDFGKWHQLLLD